ncbi:MAG: aminomethyl-transferring glycine dehydrogenase subunit GcvPA, partial [Muribaculaceae bacterium]|nr:aminomethyl-transferring glycine dehydrogenase subunit GcvPA [Muribaculaceae bacterium]
MMHRYFPHTDEDIRSMLEVCKVKSLDDLYADVPEELLLKEPYNLPEELCEKDVRDFFNNLAADNVPDLICFAGAGYYDHYAPAAINSLISRSEFLTSYTPYQPEISQGTLQYIFEYQTMICRLTGMEISNASMYDGATATAEAMILASANNRKRHRILYTAALNPEVEAVIKTYARYHGVPLTKLPEVDGVTSIEALEEALAEGDVAGVILATPNYHGILEDLTGVADLIHDKGALLIINCVAGDLATIKSPGEWGADIAVGDAQSLGVPLNFGGPYLGFMAAKKSLMRKLPGRIVGATTDDLGNRVFVLTLQAREQHIRREKATSNICSNQGLMALYVTIYMSLLGDKGLDEVTRAG